MRKFLFSLLLLNILACRPDPELPQWDTRVLTPLVYSRIDINDLVADSNLSYDPNGNLSLVYRQSITEFIPNEIIQPLTDSFRNVIRVDDIYLGEPKFQDEISLGQLADNGSTAGAIIIANHGQRATVPPFPNQGPRNFPVNATGIFQSINLSQGNLLVEIENGLPVDLTGIDYELRNQGATTPILQASLDTLKPGATYQRSFSLANQQISGNLEAVLKRFSSSGTGNDTVLIDTSQSLVFRVALSDLQAESATAIFPDQVLASDTSLIEGIQVGDAQLTAIEVAEGSIYLDASGTIEDELQLDYLVPEASADGQVLRINQSLPPASPGQLSSFYEERDIAGYRIGLEGLPGSVNSYNEFYSVLFGQIDSSGNLITLSQTDSVLLKTGVRDMIASKGYGYLGKDTLQSDETTGLSFFDFLQGGSFDLADFKLGLEIENYIGAPLSFQLDELIARGRDTLSLSSTLLGQPQSVGAAQEIGEQISPALSRLELNSSNSNVDQLFELQPQTISSKALSILNPGQAIDYQQFIHADAGVKAFITADIPMRLSARGLSFTDTNDFDYYQFDPKEQWQSGALNLIVNNRYPFGGEVSMQLLGAEGDTLHRLISTDGFNSAIRDDEGRATALQQTVIKFPIDKEEVALLRQTQRIVLFVELSTPPNEKVKLSSGDYLDLTLSADLNVRTR